MSRLLCESMHAAATNLLRSDQTLKNRIVVAWVRILANYLLGHFDFLPAKALETSMPTGHDDVEVATPRCSELPKASLFSSSEMPQFSCDPAVACIVHDLFKMSTHH